MLLDKGEKELIPYIAVALILIAFFYDPWFLLIILSFMIFMMLSVPCGMREINNNMFMWFLRQFAFAFLATGFLILGVRSLK